MCHRQDLVRFARSPQALSDAGRSDADQLGDLVTRDEITTLSHQPVRYLGRSESEVHDAKLSKARIAHTLDTRMRQATERLGVGEHVLRTC